MIRVLHIINGADLGGISTLLLNFYSNMDRNLIHFDFVYSNEGPLGYNGQKFIEMGCEFYFVPGKSKNLKAYITNIRKILLEGQYDIIHAHSCHSSWVSLKVAKKIGIKKRFSHAHNAVKGRLPLRVLISRYVGIVLNNKYSTNLVACTEEASVYTFGSRSLKSNKLTILNNSIDTSKYVFDKKARIKIRQEFEIPEDYFVFGTVGRMSREKNQVFLIDVLKEMVSRSIKNVKLVLVGDGDQRMTIAEKAKELGVQDYVIFTGQRSDVNKVLSAFDVFTLPSLNEGFGMVAIEAACSGLPVVLSDAVPRAVSFIPNSAFVSLDNTEKWVDYIDDFRKISKRENGIKAVVDNGYDIRSTTKQLIDLYEA